MVSTERTADFEEQPGGDTPADPGPATGARAGPPADLAWERFERLYHREYPVTAAWARALCPEDPEPLVQELFMSLWRRYGGGVPEQPAFWNQVRWNRRAEFFRPKYTNSRNRGASKRKLQIFYWSEADFARQWTVESPDVEAQFLRHEEEVRVRQGLRALAPRDRLLLVETYLRERPAAEVAAALGMTQEAAKSAIRRARAALRKRLTENTPPDA